jgi:hypothetical protein
MAGEGLFNNVSAWPEKACSIMFQHGRIGAWSIKSVSACLEKVVVNKLQF